jgi:hypothetical protein
LWANIITRTVAENYFNALGWHILVVHALDDEKPIAILRVRATFAKCPSLLQHSHEPSINQAELVLCGEDAIASRPLSFNDFYRRPVHSFFPTPQPLL